ncbi:MAG: DUF4922 domain-containing protein [Rikenellaceae bacterium]|jgi:hypothetical protein|nr:DUF4922 domain-containing protein [Rikenellaceae bacterium]
MTGLRQRIDKLFDVQLAVWPLLRANRRTLSRLAGRETEAGGERLALLFNPERARSTVAPLDAESVRRRPCFLCATNRPPLQQAVEWRTYQILINPYPVLDRHLTIANGEHRDQRIAGRTTDFTALAVELEGYTILYNGAKCGASAPDHHHFQAVLQGSLPLEQKSGTDDGRTVWWSDPTGHTSVWSLADGLRRVIGIEVKFSEITENTRELAAEKAAVLMETILAALAECQPGEPEAKVNALAWADATHLTVLLLPREKHRPVRFFRDDGGQVLFSPGAIDMAGLVITVRPEDFKKLDSNMLEEMFLEVIPSDVDWREMTKNCTRWLDKNP